MDQRQLAFQHRMDGLVKGTDRAAQHHQQIRCRHRMQFRIGSLQIAHRIATFLQQRLQHTQILEVHMTDRHCGLHGVACVSACGQ